MHPHPLNRHYYPDSCFAVNLYRLERSSVPCTASRRGWPGSRIEPWFARPRSARICDSATLRLGSQHSQRPPPSTTCHWPPCTPRSEAWREKHRCAGCDWADETLQWDRCIGNLAKLIRNPVPNPKGLLAVLATFPPESRLTRAGKGDFRLLSTGHWPTCCSRGVAESGVGVLWAWLLERIIEIWG